MDQIEGVEVGVKAVLYNLIKLPCLPETRDRIKTVVADEDVNLVAAVCDFVPDSGFIPYCSAVSANFLEMPDTSWCLTYRCVRATKCLGPWLLVAVGTMQVVCQVLCVALGVLI